MTTTNNSWARIATALRAVAWRDAALIVPVILVNVGAFMGQLTWARLNLDAGPWMPWVFAAALETTGIYLAWEAHAALMAGDAALRLRLASYGVAGLVGFLNYSVHAGPGWVATPSALAFGAMSALSPWLWSIRSRSMHRAELRATGLIDSRAVRFSMARWVLYPRWTFRVWRAAVWAGETNPEEAAARFTPGSTRPVETPPAPAVESPAASAPVGVPRAKTDHARPTPRPKPVNGLDPAWVAAVADAMAAGNAPSLRSLKGTYQIGEPKARALLAAAMAQGAGVVAG